MYLSNRVAPSQWLSQGASTQTQIEVVAISTQRLGMRIPSACGPRTVDIPQKYDYSVLGMFSAYQL